MTEPVELEEPKDFEQQKKNNEAHQGPAPRTRRKVLFAIAGVLLLGGVAEGGYLYLGTRVSTDDAQVDAHNAPIAPKISGNVAEIMVGDNQMVKAGQVLVRIDPRDYQARVDQARAALAMAQSNSLGAGANVPLTEHITVSAVSSADGQLAAAEAQYLGSKSDYDRASTSELAYAQADVDSKRATRERAKSDLSRMGPLVEKDEISKQQFDSYVATARVAESDLQAAEENLTNARKRADSSHAAVLQALARVNAAKGDLEQAKANRQKVEISSAQAGSAAASIQHARADLGAAELQLSYTSIYAPIAGMVTRKTIQTGQIVQAGQTLLIVVPLDEVWVTANFKETQLANVRPGQRAEVNVDMYGRSFEARVESIAGATGASLSLLPPENATGNYVKVVERIPVKIVLTGTPSGFVLRPGMNADATIFTK